MIKNHLSFLIICLLMAALFIKCKKEETSDTLPAPKIYDTIESGTSAYINNAIWVAAETEVNIRNGHIYFSAHNANNEEITFYLKGTEPGIYTLNSGSENLAYYGDSVANTYFSYGNGSMPGSVTAGGVVYISTISEDTITGSFMLSMFNSKKNTFKNISQGNFKNIIINTTGNITTGLDGVINGNEDFKASLENSKAISIDKKFMIFSFKTSSNDYLEMFLQSDSSGVYQISQNLRNYIFSYSENFGKISSTSSNIMSFGVITNITDTSKKIHSGTYAFNLFNEDNSPMACAGTYKQLINNKQQSLKETYFNCSIDNKSFNSDYSFFLETFDRSKYVILDNKNKIRFMILLADTSSGISYQLSKENRNTFITYFDENGKLYLSTTGSLKDTTFGESKFYGFDFKATCATDNTEIIVKEGLFEYKK